MTYEFRCSACGRDSDQQLHYSKAPHAGETSPAACPHCGQRKLTRILSAGNIAVSARLAASQIRANLYPYVSRQMGDVAGIRRYTDQGHAIIESKQHEDRVCKMNRRVRV